MDLNIATKLTFKQILKEFLKLHIKSVINVIILTILIYVLYIRFILYESNINSYLIYSEFLLITLPLTLTIITLNLILLFIFINSFINLIDIIIRLIINICISFPRVIRFLLMIFKIKKENHNVLMKYVHHSFTPKDSCSICLCPF